MDETLTYWDACLIAKDVLKKQGQYKYTLTFFTDNELDKNKLKMILNNIVENIYL